MSSQVQSPELSSSPKSMDWNNYPNFKASEFACKHCGEVKMDVAFMDKLQTLRTRYGKSIIITSGYRCKSHPVEAKKATSGAHTKGKAADLAVNGQDAYKVLKIAFDLGFTGIGVNQKGQGRFIHLDTVEGAPRPNVWSY